MSVENEDSEQTRGEQQWQRLELLSRSPDEDGARLLGLGALGIEVQDDTTYMEGAAFAPVPEGQTRLIAFFEADRPTAELRRNVEDSLPGAEIVSLAHYDDRSWETAWMDYFEAIDLSPRVSVGPPWDRPEPSSEGLSLVIEPGMAFGTGSHETTSLCVQIIDDLLAQRDVESVLDVGCGSAILSMVAAGLGVERVVAIDIDPTAVDVARANIEKNGFSPQQIEVSTRPVHQLEERFDLVVANILAPILLELRSPLQRVVATGGDLVLCGIPTEQLDEILTAFGDAHWSLLDVQHQGEWTALHLRKNQEN